MPLFNNGGIFVKLIKVAPGVFVERDRLEEIVEHLIWLIDTADGDPDIEDSEPGEDDARQLEKAQNDSPRFIGDEPDDPDDDDDST
jgi:hypothetical protein